MRMLIYVLFHLVILKNLGGWQVYRSMSLPKFLVTDVVVLIGCSIELTQKRHYLPQICHDDQYFAPKADIDFVLFKSQ